MTLIDKDNLMEEMGITSSCDNCGWMKSGWCSKGNEFAYACEMVTDADEVDAMPILFIDEVIDWLQSRNMNMESDSLIMLLHEWEAFKLTGQKHYGEEDAVD